MQKAVKRRLKIKQLLLIIIISLLFFVIIINWEHPKIKELISTSIGAMVIVMGWVHIFASPKKDAKVITSKIQEMIMALITALGVAVAGIYIWNETENISKKFPTVYFVSNKADKPLFFDVPVLRHYLSKQHLLYSEYSRDSLLKPEDIKITDRHSFFRDLQAAAIIDYLMEEYRNNWFIERITERFPGYILTRGKHLGESKTDISTLSKNFLSKQFGINKFFKYINNIYYLTLPKDCIVTYTPYTNSHKFCQIEIKKPFYFIIDIRVYFSSYAAGLGDMAKFIGVSDDENDKIYGTLVIDTYCDAKFNKLLPGNPAMIRYKKWVSYLFDDLYDTFAWQVCYEDIKDYLEFTAHQKILTGSK